MKRLWSVFLLFCTLSTTSIAQHADLYLHKSAKRVDIPFEYKNGFIIIDIILNDVFPLRFIMDTGAEHTILTKREITDILQVNYDRKLPLMGADLRTELYAYLARGIKLQLGNVIGLNRSILVLEEDYIQFETFTGMNIHGILGADFFRRFVVKINYHKQVISLIAPRHFTPPSNYSCLPIQIERYKPYYNALVYTSQDSMLELKLLLDTGASLAMLLEVSSHPNLELPERVIPSTLGLGLGGDVKGYMGKITALNLQGFEIPEVITHFQDLSFLTDSLPVYNRNGLIGNDILSKFTLIIDYYNQKLYLSPNKWYDKKLKYDRSGLQCVAGGKNLNEFIIHYVLSGSPADKAGVQVGDQILRINGRGAALLTLSGVNRVLKKRVGKRIKLKILRGQEKRKVFFYLEELL
jgi:hypothetical protein